MHMIVPELGYLHRYCYLLFSGVSKTFFFLVNRGLIVILYDNRNLNYYSLTLYVVLKIVFRGIFYAKFVDYQD